MRSITTETIQFQSEGLTLHGSLSRYSESCENAVLLCHDAFDRQESWSNFSQKLINNQCASFTFDFTGHGLSQGTRSLVNLRTWAYNIRDALTKLEESGLRRFAVVGAGLGGSAALLAGAHDQRLACLVTLASPVTLQPSLPDRIAYSLASSAGRIRKRLFKRITAFSRLGELEKLQVFSDQAANEEYRTRPYVKDYYSAVPIPESLDCVWMDISQGVKNVKIPVSVMHGKEDRLIPVEQSKNLYELLTVEKELLQFDQSGHALHLDKESELVHQAILSWVNRYLI